MAGVSCDSCVYNVYDEEDFSGPHGTEVLEELPIVGTIE